MSGKNKRKINNKIKAKEIVNTNNGNGNIIVANNYKQITYNIVNNIIKDSQSESKDEFRNLMSSNPEKEWIGKTLEKVSSSTRKYL